MRSSFNKGGFGTNGDGRPKLYIFRLPSYDGTEIFVYEREPSHPREIKRNRLGGTTGNLGTDKSCVPTIRETGLSMKARDRFKIEFNGTGIVNCSLTDRFGNNR